MEEKNLGPETTVHTAENPMVRRQKDAPLPPDSATLRRKEKPVTTDSSLLTHVTPENELTLLQKQPLSEREKPQPSKAVFPPPLSSKRSERGARKYTQFQAANPNTEEEPMPRYEIKDTARKSEWKYTRAEKITASEEIESQPVRAKVVKMPTDKKPIILTVIAVFLALVVILGCVFGVLSGKKDESPAGKPIPDLIEKWDDPPKLVSSPTTVKTDKPASSDSAILGTAEDTTPVYEYANKSIVGFSSHYEGTIDKTAIVKPVAETRDEGLTSGYPQYGKNMSNVLGSDPDGSKSQARAALIREAAYLASSNTANGGASDYPYNKMTASGELQFVNSDGTVTNTLDKDGNQRYLYKHTAAAGMYGGDVGDEEARIIKTVTMRPRGYDGYGVTGLYAPAGEVIKIEIDEKDMNATGGLTIHIGQALYNGQANNIWVEKGQMQRFPMILNTMVINTRTATYNAETKKWTGYVGSFLGGPLYIRNARAKFTATISGCVRYSHFILGYTTEAEFKENAKSSAPYFDLEVWDKGVLHSGPKSLAADFTYDELYKAAVLWEKVASVTTYKNNQGIVFIYDPFVAAGAAVAFPGRRSVNCPTSWMKSSLDYDAIVTVGSWGNFHEYHHNFQGYGVGNGGEVTNNALNLVSYALFTKISAKRGISNYGAQGLGGWNTYTSATWALNEVLKIPKGVDPSNGKQGLALYATLLHNFGADAFMNAKVATTVQSYTAYMNAWQSVTHNNLYYYFNDLLKGADNGAALTDNADPSYPVFVPVSCVYQTGRSFLYDGEKRYFKTMRPYTIPYGEFEIDLGKYTVTESGQYAGGSIVIPDGFVYRIKSVSSPANGTIEVVDNYRLKYKPNEKAESGQIVVTLQIVKEDGAFEVDDVDLILEFEQSHEVNGRTLERTTYSYAAENMYTDAVTAYENDFAGYLNKSAYDHSNPTENSNTDIWFYPNTQQNHEKYPNAPDWYFIRDNTIEVIEGKLHFENAGKYRIYLRGRRNCAVYYSKGDKDHFTLGAAVKSGSGANFYLNDSETYFDVEFTDEEIKSGGWVYFKEVLIVQSAASSYIGLGTGQWTQTTFSVAERYYNAAGGEVESASDTSYQYTETTYSDANGNEIAVVKNDKDAGTAYFKIENGQRTPSDEQEISALTTSTLTPPSSASYANAYRGSYELPDNNFESDYFYVRSYNYDYVGDTSIVTDGKTITPTPDCNYEPWFDYQVLDNLFDDDLNTAIHFSRAWGVSEGKPAVLAFDLGEVVKANTMTLYTNNTAGGYDKGFPRNFTLEGSLDGETYFEMGKWSSLAQPAVSVELTFNDRKTFEFRYFRMTVTNTTNGRCGLAGLKFSYALRLTGNGANHVAPDNSNLKYTGNWETVHVQSSFGYSYLGSNGSTIAFDMIGTRLAILTNKGEAFTGTYEVYVDGALLSSVEVKADDGEYAISYISQKLTSGKHRVEIRCKGAVAFDSFAIYDEG